MYETNAIYVCSLNRFYNVCKHKLHSLHFEYYKNSHRSIVYVQYLSCFSQRDFCTLMFNLFIFQVIRFFLDWRKKTENNKSSKNLFRIFSMLELITELKNIFYSKCILCKSLFCFKCVNSFCKIMDRHCLTRSVWCIYISKNSSVKQWLLVTSYGPGYTYLLKLSRIFLSYTVTRLSVG